jgi:hypothetical protein
VESLPLAFGTPNPSPPQLHGAILLIVKNCLAVSQIFVVTKLPQMYARSNLSLQLLEIRMRVLSSQEK